jgi:formylglycine-generating enzyme required for sulfatase activity
MHQKFAPLLAITVLALIGILSRRVSSLPQTTLLGQTTPTSIPAGTIVKDSSGYDMVYVPSGNFEMGITRDEYIKVCVDVLKATDRECVDLVDAIEEQAGKLHKQLIQIPSFWIDRYEVTIEQYLPCMVAGQQGKGCRKISNAWNPKLEDDSRKPQVSVNWYDAMLVCNIRRARLPTEAEWEYAARGPNNLLLPWGNTLNKSYLSPTDATYPVGSKAENKSWVGAFDMAGNAAEWVEDRFWTNTIGGPSSGSRDDTARVIRGGSWGNQTTQIFGFDRASALPNDPDSTIGFRCARTGYPLN